MQGGERVYQNLPFNRNWIVVQVWRLIRWSAYHENIGTMSISVNLSKSQTGV